MSMVCMSDALSLRPQWDDLYEGLHPNLESHPTDLRAIKSQSSSQGFVCIVRHGGRSKGMFRLAGREFPKVTWYKDPNMRKTYICLMFAVLTSVTQHFKC